MVLIAGEAGIPENTVNLTYLWILRGKFGGLTRFESAPALFSLFAKNLVAPLVYCNKYNQFGYLVGSCSRRETTEMVFDGTPAALHANIKSEDEV